jgi:hypothetical protein
MKRNFTWLVSAWILCSLGASAQTSDNFNSRPGVTLSQVKSYLEDKCWQFIGFDINQADGTSAIEGDGAMVSEAGEVTPDQPNGIYTPVLNLPGVLNVKFSFRFSESFYYPVRRWINIYVTDPDNSIVDLLYSQEVEIATEGEVHYFDNWFSTVTGPRKIFISYQGMEGEVRVAIDEIEVSAPLYYATGCNASPVAVNDMVGGQANRHASGTVIPNDSDPNNDNFTAYLETESPHGTVVLNPDGTFTFTPNPGWAGNTTSFTYRICDNGFPALCSEPAIVTINFPNNASLPVSLKDLKGLYRDNGNVEISWVTTFEVNSDRFEIERSLDGEKWTVVGEVKAQGNSTIETAYKFIDEAGRDRANKKDLYYRLRQIDKDNTVSLSKILIVRVYNTRTLKMVSVTPNPAKNDISVNIQLNEDAFVSMKVLNAGGAMMLNKSLKVSVGANTFILDGTSKLKPGLYVLEVIINSKERMIVKLIKE